MSSTSLLPVEIDDCQTYVSQKSDSDQFHDTPAARATISTWIFASSPITLHDVDTLPTLFCLTNGHPEHAGSLQSFPESPESRPHLPSVHLISSADVIRHINRNGILPPENVHPVGEVNGVTIAGVVVTEFQWVHMPLFPPGLRENTKQVFQHLTHPVKLVRIGMLGLSLPKNAPQLGFHIAFPDGTSVLNYSEGVHRHTNAAEVERVAQNHPAGTLVFAVEPGDAEAIPRWVESPDSKVVYFYEVHQPWRDMFHLPYLDLDRFAQKMSTRFPAKTFRALMESGETTATVAG